MRHKVEWMDIVKVNGDYHLERHDIEFEEKEFDGIYLGNDEKSILNNAKLTVDKYNSDCLFYDCSNFFSYVIEKYNLDENEEIETYLFNDIELPEEVTQKYDIAWLGGYINGVNF